MVLLDSARCAETRDVQSGRLLAHERPSRTGILLLSGHRGNPVVKDDEHAPRLVHHRVDKACNTGMEKSGITEDAEDFLGAAGLFLRFLETDDC